MVGLGLWNALPIPPLVGLIPPAPPMPTYLGRLVLDSTRPGGVKLCHMCVHTLSLSLHRNLLTRAWSSAALSWAAISSESRTHGDVLAVSIGCCRLVYLEVKRHGSCANEVDGLTPCRWSKIAMTLAPRTRSASLLLRLPMGHSMAGYLSFSISLLFLISQSKDLVYLLPTRRTNRVLALADR